jgi:hypothetical protein
VCALSVCCQQFVCERVLSAVSIPPQPAGCVGCSQFKLPFLSPLLALEGREKGRL